MTSTERLESLVKELTDKLEQLPRKVLLDVKKLMDLHTHEMGGKVVWKVPPEVMKEIMKRVAEKNSVSRDQDNFAENVTAKDQFIATLTPVG